MSLARRALALTVSGAFLTIGGCMSGSAPLVHSSSAVKPSAYHYVDGGSSVYFTFDKSLVQSAAASTYIFVVGGSGCRGMGQWLPQYFRGLDGESGPLRVFVIHKRFVSAFGTEPDQDCSDQFARTDHPRRWLADYREFIDAQLADQRPARVVLVGISEGAEIVPRLAQIIPGVSRVVLLGSGAMDPLDAFALQSARSGYDARGELLELVDRYWHAPDEPRDVLGGHSPRYWRELQDLHPTRDLLQAGVQVLVGMGVDDQAMPIQTAWALRSSFALNAPGRLTLLTYESADHALFDSNQRRSRLPDFWHAVDLWLADEMLDGPVKLPPAGNTEAARMQR